MSPTSKILDARGLPCPQPVILTRKALSEGGFDLLEVIVDNAAALENVVRFATHAHTIVEGVETSGSESHIRILPGTTPANLPPGEAFCSIPPSTQANALIQTVFLSSSTLGRGSDELGALLMRGFLYTLTESEALPRRLILMNSGVLLATEDSEHLANLQRLTHLGVEILACGTCLEFFKVKDKLAAGRISNMQEIASILLQGNVLTF